MRVFTGTLSHGEHKLRLKVQINLDAAGEVVFRFREIPVTTESSFLFAAWDDHDFRSSALRFSGVARDKTRFETVDFHLTRWGHRSDESQAYLRIGGYCSTGVFRCPLTASTPTPVLRMHLSGYESSDGYQTTCRLGTVTIETYGAVGKSPNALSGVITVAATRPPEDLARWREEAERLLEHIRMLMSVAASSLLRAPDIELYFNTEGEVRTVSQTARSGAGVPRAVHYMAQKEIFVSAVESFFSPPLKVNRLSFAIQWFVMETTYNEVRLLCAMTALENLVESNLGKSDARVQRSSPFDKMKDFLRDETEKYLVSKLGSEHAQEVFAEVDEKWGELNRRSLLRKIYRLAQHWNVVLDPITRDSINDAIKARNYVVHRGWYYEDKEPTDADLWTHAMLIREVVLRFIFTAIGHSGKYISYIGHAHDKQFPPTQAQ